MKTFMRQRWALIVALSIWVFWIPVWALTETEPQLGQGYYGNVMTILDQSSAEMFGIDKPGIYVCNKNHKPVTAVRGGLGMVLRGSIMGDNIEMSVGWRGVQAGLFHSLAGILLLCTIGLSFAMAIPWQHFRKRQVGAKGVGNLG